MNNVCGQAIPSVDNSNAKEIASCCCVTSVYSICYCNLVSRSQDWTVIGNDITLKSKHFSLYCSLYCGLMQPLLSSTVPFSSQGFDLVGLMTLNFDK
jgi:hypothetical protein